MRYTPKKKKIQIVLVLIVSLFLTLLAVAISKAFTLPDAVWQAVFFICAFVICDLSAKCFLPIYTYDFDEDSFVVTKRLSNKTTVVCNVDMRHVVSLYDYAEYKKQEDYNVKNTYFYRTNPFASSCYILVFDYNSVVEGVVFEAEESVANSIRGLIKSL